MKKEYLPIGWAEERLADVIEPRGEKVAPSDFPEYKFIGMDHVESQTTRIVGSVPATEMKSNASRFYTGDVLYGRLRPYLNKVAQPQFCGIASAEFIVFPDTSLIKSDFLKYRLNAADFVSFASHLNEGDRPRVGFDQIGDFRFLVPPPKEQKRIVARIEELFSELDKGIESLKTAREQLKVYSQAVLEYAVSEFATTNLSYYPLSDLIGPIQQGWSPKCDPNRTPLNEEWAVIKTTAVQPMHYFSQECKPLPINLKPRPAIEIHNGDILMTRKGPRPRTGVVCLVRNVRPRSMLCDTVYRFKSVQTLITPEYLELVLNTPMALKQIDARKSGISDSGISLNHDRLRSIVLPVPKSVQMQVNIVEKVRVKLSGLENLDAEIESQLTKASVLKQSILKKAFSGKLVPQDPDNEPVSVLLERIRAEKEDQSGKRSSSRNGKRHSEPAPLPPLTDVADDANEGGSVGLGGLGRHSAMATQLQFDHIG